MSTVERALGGPAIEVVAKARRRRFTLEYKRKIVREADACKAPGAVGALLRREGLYSSHLTTWRAARERGELAGAAKKRGPAPRVTDARDKVIAEQARELAWWKHRAERAEALEEAQSHAASAGKKLNYVDLGERGKYASRAPAVQRQVGLVPLGRLVLTSCEGDVCPNSNTPCVSTKAVGGEVDDGVLVCFERKAFLAPNGGTNPSRPANGHKKSPQTHSAK